MSNLTMSNLTYNDVIGVIASPEGAKQSKGQRVYYDASDRVRCAPKTSILIIDNNNE